MIENLEIIDVNPPSDAVFPLERKVILEKFQDYNFSITKQYIHYSNTILKPGEHIWFIDAKTLSIEKYTISEVPRVMTSDSRIYFFGKNTKNPRMFQISLHNYLTRIDKPLLTRLGVGLVHNMGEKYMCSSEQNILKTLSHCIPIVAKKIQENLGKRNTKFDKVLGKKSRLKKIQKLHKKVVEFLKNN